MIKTQIQLPDALYRQVKRVAKEREISLAEVLRRGAEYIIGVYPPLANKPAEDPLPGPFHLGLKQDPFAQPDWRYDLHERATFMTAVREAKPSTPKKRTRKQP